MRKVLLSCLGLSLLLTSSLLAKEKSSPCASIYKSLGQIAAAKSVDKLSKHIADPLRVGLAPYEPSDIAKEMVLLHLNSKEGRLYETFFLSLPESIKGKTLRTTYFSKGDPEDMIPIQKSSCLFGVEEDFSIYIKLSAKDWLIYGVLSY